MKASLIFLWDKGVRNLWGKMLEDTIKGLVDKWMSDESKWERLGLTRTFKGFQTE